ncbi:hypothetical protein AMS69_18485 [Haloarcula rubripromontorii]|uniref:DUF354 domain-containing protein n=1 Tax=Haloarcula rubripromontorii TaxID=1705562 RepID=A0A0N0BMS6_9EURY|nr:DUF354 domain-containing protein [Haloarcula rubripromontorii]KOX91480.1 hypothetical protein AMS69_18485 [Haloarcula rubripromontorii]
MSKRVLFSVNHPAQVHLFKYAARELEAEGFETLVAAREKEMTADLLSAEGLDYVTLTTESDGLVELTAELAKRERRLYNLAREFDPSVIVARLAPPAVHVATALGCRNLVYMDTVLRPQTVRLLYHGLTLPFVDDICSPPGMDFHVPFGQSHTVGFQELAYLHPDRFKPEPERLRAHGVNPDATYTVVRLAGWDAYHDIGEKGLDVAARSQLVEQLCDRGEVYITCEGDLPSEYDRYQLAVPPHLVHDLLYFADLYIGDSQTMPTEAALLGTPAIRINSVVGDNDMHNFLELEERELLYSYTDGTAAIDRAEALLADDDAERWERERKRLLAQQRDVTEHMVELIRTGGNG